VERAAPQAPVLAMLSRPANLEEVAKALPAGYTVDRFIRLARTAIQTSPQLLECHPTSVVAALHRAASYGLDVGPVGHAYLVPFGGKAQLIIGYRGMIALARRSGELASVEARAVRANDEFDYAFGLEQRLVHRPALSDRGDIVCFWGLARFTNGGTYFVVVDLDTIEAHRQESKTGAQDKGPWKTHYEAMGAKTVIRIMEPYLPLTTDAAEVMQGDEVPVDESRFAYLDTTMVDIPDPFDEPELGPPPEHDPEPGDGDQ
jgi:recombination protein RecT